MNRYEKWRLWLLKTIQLQLFISLISLPFLVGWGLPISLLSPFATILFGPFLTSFLLLSSAVFFLELLHLPNALPIYLLEIVTKTWLWCLKYNQQSWLIGFSKPSFFFLLCIIIAAVGTLHSKKIKTIHQRISYLSLLLVIICIALKWFPYTYKQVETIPCNKGEITIINTNNCITLIDPGFIASRPSYESWISYTLIPEIIKKTGSMTIDHLVLYKINKRVFDAITFLGTKMIIKNIYIPWWTGRIPLFAWKSYAKLKKTVTDSGGKISSLSHYRLIFKTKHSTLSIEPRGTKDIRYYSATYPSLCVKGSINKQKIAL